MNLKPFSNINICRNDFEIIDSTTRNNGAYSIVEASDSDDSQHHSYIGCKMCKSAISSVYYDYRYFKKKYQADVEEANYKRSSVYYR